MDPKLYEAAVSGDIIFLQKITDPKLDLDQVTPQKNTVLHIAVNFKQLEFSKQVLSLCPSLLLKANAKGESAVHVAAKIGCFEIAEHLVNSATTLVQDVESRVVDAQKRLLRMLNQEKDTALHVAVRNGQLEVAKLLMKATDPGLLEFVNSADASPLYLAVDGNFFNIVHCILEFSPESHFGGPRGMTALHSAVIRERHEIVQVLLEKIPDIVKQVDIYGRTPLHYAAYESRVETTRLLLKCDSSAAYLLDKDGTSALHIAAFEGHIHIVEELIQYCPDIVELTDKKGRTALHVAVLGGREKMVKQILKMSKFVTIINEQDEEGNTALHLAVIHKRVNIIKYLALDKRMKKTAMNKEFSTAYDIFLSETDVLSFSAAKVSYFLSETWGLPFSQKWVDTHVKRQMMGEAKEQEKSVSDAVKENSDEKTRSMLEIHLLVAMLIATVTFAAAFTMPGGYEDNGHDKGMAAFIEKKMFKAFVIFNTTAFCFSIATVIIHVATSLQSYRYRTRYTPLALKFIQIAIIGMVLAFASSVYLVLAKSIGLALTPCIMAVSCLLGHRVLWFFDPTGKYFPGLVRARKYLRDLLFHYGIV